MSMLSAMTWKSTVVVSGVGVLATWLASIPPANAPSSPGSVPTQSTAPAAVSIGEQAERLGTRVRAEIEYREPARNPFRFSARAIPSAPRDDRRVQAQLADVAPPQPALTVRLSGIATDTIDGRPQRTAILSTSSGLVFVREGGAVGEYRVGTVGEDAVDLIQADGSLIRIR